MADDITANQNRGPQVLAVTTALFVAATFAVILRFVSRVGIVKRISADDYAMIAAWLIAFGFTFSICYGTSVGLGRHEENIRPEHHPALRKSEYAFSNPALMATKTSICFFYLTLAKNQQVFKWATIATLVVVNVAGTALTLLNIFQCRPIDGAFGTEVPDNVKCLDIIALYLSSAPINIITDLALLFLPMPILTAMRLPRNEKLILIVTFSFGAFVTAVDVVRIAYLQNASLSRARGTSGSSIANQRDFSWIASLSFMWSAIEVDVGIICACVPGVKPLAAKLFPKLLGRIKHARDYGYHHHHHGAKDEQAPDRSDSNPLATPPGSPVKTRFTGLGADAGAGADGAKSANGKMESMDFMTTPDMNTDDLRRSNTTRSEKEDIDMVDFLNPPKSPTFNKRDTTMTASSTKARKGSMTVFDFVDMNSPKSMVRMSNRESLPALCFVTVLFFLWGFAYGLLSILNAQFQRIVHVSDAQAQGLHAAYFAAYFVAPLTFGRLVFNKWGFRQTFIIGLCVYGTGTMIFWPSAVLLSYPAFLISNFIVGLGVATLELGGNPFIALCGPPEYAEIRLNISQAVQAIGSVVSPILAQQVLFKGVTDAASLIDIQWTYLGIALFVVVLALVFFYLPIPEASDEDLQRLADEREDVNTRKVCGITVTYLTLAFGVFSQFCYVGGQEAVAGVFLQYVDIVKPQSDIGAFNYLSSGVFSIIFAMCLRGLGSRMKMGSVMLTVATSGGAVIPVIMDPVNSSRGIRYGFSVPLAVFAFGLLLPLYTTIVPAARQQVDPVLKRPANMSSSERPSTARSLRRRLGNVAKRKEQVSESPQTEDDERKDKGNPG
ncbi:MAG: hypothetical protein Q9169_007079 [Polycauliona sp. 2 TL-2023]